MHWGIYTAGTYYFPVVMFLIPLAGIVHFGKVLLARSRQASPATVGRGQPGRDVGQAQQPSMPEGWQSSQR